MSTRKSNISVSLSDFNADHKFINVAKAGSRILGNNAASDRLWYDNTKLNDDMYPVEATNGVHFETYMLPGTYVVRWQGSGSVTSASVTSKTNASSGIYTGGGSDGSIVINGRYTCTASNSYISWIVKGTAISNVVICLASEEALLDGGQMYRTAYTNTLKGYNGILRFLNSCMGDANVIGALCNWADRPLTSLLTYNAGRYYSTQKAGIATGTNDYVLASYAGMPVSYTHGEVVHFNIGASNGNTSTACTLDAGGRGPKTLVQINNNGPLTTGVDAAQRLFASQTVTAVYDSVLDRFLFETKSYHVVGQPLEAMIQECNESGCPGWFHIPFWASDDYVTQFATLLCTSYTPSEVYIEYVNEVWNNAGGFPFTALSTAYGTSVLGIGGGNFANTSGWYGYRLRQISTLMRAVFATNGQSSKLKMVLASQGAAGDLSATLAAQVENVRFQNSAVTALSRSNGNAPIDFVDVVSYALYFGGNSCSAGTSTTTLPNDNGWSLVAHNIPNFKTNAVDAYLAGNTKAAFDWMRDDLIANWSQSSGAFLNRITNWNTLAASYGKEVRLYESNWQLSAPSTTWCTQGIIRLLANSTFIIGTNAFTTCINSLGLKNTSGTSGVNIPAVGGDTINPQGLAGLARSNKAGSAITANTALSGTAGTDSVVTDFAAGNTISIGATTITFVASGASGNTQINITDTIGVLLSKIDAITATSNASFVVATGLDSSYGGQTGKINQFYYAFFASYQCEQAIRRILKDFYSLSKSRGWSLFYLPGAFPWSAFAQPSLGTNVGDTTNASFGNWNAIGHDNSAKRQMVW